MHKENWRSPKKERQRRSAARQFLRTKRTIHLLQNRTVLFVDNIPFLKFFQPAPSIAVHICRLTRKAGLNNEETMITLNLTTSICDQEFQPMKEMAILFLIITVWILLQAYILPRMGVSTWMNAACQVADKKDPKKNGNTPSKRGNK